MAETKYIVTPIDSATKVPVVLTFGLHTELQELLQKDNGLFRLFEDSSLAQEVIYILLAKRGPTGEAEGFKIPLTQLSAEDFLGLLNFVYDYFEEFFLASQVRIQKTTEKLSQISRQSTPS